MTQFTAGSFYLVHRMTVEERPHKTGFDAHVSLDYMGSSEYEWGGPNRALKAIREPGDITVTSAEVTRKGVTRTAWFTGPASTIDEAVTAFTEWVSAEHLDSMEATYMDRYFEGEDTWRIDAWWAYNALLMWSFDEAKTRVIAEALAPVA